MRIVEVDKAILIHSALVNPKSGNELMDSVDYGKDISKLNKTFGGKKIRSRLQQREKLNVNSALVADELKEAVEGDIIIT